MSSWSTSVLPLPPLRASVWYIRCQTFAWHSLALFWVLTKSSKLSRAGFCCPPLPWTVQPSTNSCKPKVFLSRWCVSQNGKEWQCSACGVDPTLHPVAVAARTLFSLPHCPLMVLGFPDVSDFSKICLKIYPLLLSFLWVQLKLSWSWKNSPLKETKELLCLWPPSQAWSTFFWAFLFLPSRMMQKPSTTPISKPLSSIPLFSLKVMRKNSIFLTPKQHHSSVTPSSNYQEKQHSPSKSHTSSCTHSSVAQLSRKPDWNKVFLLSMSKHLPSKGTSPEGLFHPIHFSSSSSQQWRQQIQKPWPDFPGCSVLPTPGVWVCWWTRGIWEKFYTRKLQAGPGHKAPEGLIQRLSSPHLPLLQLLRNSSHSIPALIIVLFTLHGAAIKSSTGGGKKYHD